MDALDILRDPSTPQWIKDGFSRIERDNPSYAALLIALHDRAAKTRQNEEPSNSL